MVIAPQKYLTNLIIFLLVGITLVKSFFSLSQILTSFAPDFAYYYQVGWELTTPTTGIKHFFPPASLILYYPLHLLPYSIAQGLWVIISFLFLIAIIWQLGSLVGIHSVKTLVCLAALAFCYFPTRFSLGMGQVNLIALFMFTLALVLEQRKRSFLAGCALALAILYKPELLLLYLMLLFVNRGTMMVVAALFILLAIFVSLLFLGKDAYFTYFQGLGNPIAWWSGIGIYYNQSLAALVSRIGFSYWPYLIVSLTVMLTTWLMFYKRSLHFMEKVWILLPVFILIEPIAWQHHLVFLLPTYLALFQRSSTLFQKILLVSNFMLVGMNLPDPGTISKLPLGWLINSHATVGTIILWLISF